MKVNDQAFLGYQTGTVRMLKPRVKKRGGMFHVTYRLAFNPPRTDATTNKATP